MNTAEYIIKKLEELGINDFFGLPGDYNFSIIQAIENNSNIQWIGCTNELNAGYAADGYARIRGFGALVTTYGVGELSAVNAIAGSYAENVAVINIVGVPSTKDIENRTLRHHNFQDANYNTFYQIYKNITSAAAFLNRDNAKIEIDRVLKTFVKERKPVYIAVPIDIAQMEISDRDVSYEVLSDKETLQKVAEKISIKINKAEKPVILGDVLIKRFDSLIEYKEFVAKSGIPVTNFMMGNNLINAGYEKYLGGYYSKYKNPIAQKYVEDSDCLISVGPIYSDLNSCGMNLPFEINNHIAIYGNYTYVDGEKYDNVKMADVLETVAPLLRDRDISIEKPNAGYKIKAAENVPLTSAFLYPRLQEFFKENDIVFAETGSVPFGIAQVKFPVSANIETQILWASIGWATPALFGASLAKSQSRAVLITGEGAHQLTAMEIGSMLRYGLKPIIIVINNKGYAIERLLSNDTESNYNNIMQMNYAKFARVFDGDVWATKITTEDDFDKALKVTQIMNKMCYLEVCTEKLDIPNLLKDFVSCSNKEQTNYEKQEQVNDFNEEYVYEEDLDSKYAESINDVKVSTDKNEWCEDIVDSDLEVTENLNTESEQEAEQNVSCSEQTIEDCEVSESNTTNSVIEENIKSEEKVNSGFEFETVVHRGIDE